ALRAHVEDAERAVCARPAEAIGAVDVATAADLRGGGGWDGDRGEGEEQQDRAHGANRTVSPCSSWPAGSPVRARRKPWRRRYGSWSRPPVLSRASSRSTST